MLITCIIELWLTTGFLRSDEARCTRQPGYGTSYITGKHLIERLIAEVSRQRGEDFNLMPFFEEFNAAGVIPVSLLRWQLTGEDDEIRALTGAD